MNLGSELTNTLSKGACTLTPYPHVTLQNVLSQEAYDKWREKFPPIETFSMLRDTNRSNVAVGITLPEVIQRPDLFSDWTETFYNLTSKEHFRKMIQFYSSGISQYYPELGDLEDLRIGRYGVDSDSECDVLLDCHLMINTPVKSESRVRGPHLDNFQALYVALFYFRDDDDDSAGGNFIIYEKTTDNFRLGSGRSVAPRCIRPVVEVPYLGNNMVSFLNTRDSVHGVSARSITPFARRYITFNAVLNRPLFHYKRKRSMKRYASCLTRLLGRKQA